MLDPLIAGDISLLFSPVPGIPIQVISPFNRSFPPRAALSDSSSSSWRAGEIAFSFFYFDRDGAFQEVSFSFFFSSNDAFIDCIFLFHFFPGFPL